MQYAIMVDTTYAANNHVEQAVSRRLMVTFSRRSCRGCHRLPEKERPES